MKLIIVVTAVFCLYNVGLAQTPGRPSAPSSNPMINTTSSPFVEQWKFIDQHRLGRYRVMMPSSGRLGQTFPLVVLLHGNGNTPDMMLQWARTLQLDSFIFVCPEAPYVKVAETIDNHSEKYTAMADAIGIPDTLTAQAITLSADWYFSAVLDAQKNLPVDPSRKPSLVGFSQGGFYAHVLLGRHPDAFGIVVSICASMYPAGAVIEKYPALASYNVQLIVAHARQDPVVPFQTGELIHSALDNAKVKHQFIPFDGEHWPSPELTAELARRIR